MFVTNDRALNQEERRILVPVDGSELSLHALDVGVGLARSLGLGLIVCHVVDPAKAAEMTFGNPQFIAECVGALRAEGESILQTATKRVGHVDGVESLLLQGNPAEEIVRVAKELGADWIVTGSHGRRGLSRMLMGSVAEGVLRHADVPVMIVPRERTHAAVRFPGKASA